MVRYTEVLPDSKVVQCSNKFQTVLLSISWEQTGSDHVMPPWNGQYLFVVWEWSPQRSGDPCNCLAPLFPPKGLLFSAPALKATLSSYPVHYIGWGIEIWPKLVLICSIHGLSSLFHSGQLMRPGSIQILPWEFQHRKWEKEVNLSWDSRLVKWEPQVFLVLIYGQSIREDF